VSAELLEALGAGSLEAEATVWRVVGAGEEAAGDSVAGDAVATAGGGAFDSKVPVPGATAPGVPTSDDGAEEAATSTAEVVAACSGEADAGDGAAAGGAAAVTVTMTDSVTT